MCTGKLNMGSSTPGHCSQLEKAVPVLVNCLVKAVHMATIYCTWTLDWSKCSA